MPTPSGYNLNKKKPMKSKKKKIVKKGTKKK